MYNKKQNIDQYNIIHIIICIEINIIYNHCIFGTIITQNYYLCLEFKMIISIYSERSKENIQKPFGR